MTRLASAFRAALAPTCAARSAGLARVRAPRVAVAARAIASSAAARAPSPAARPLPPPAELLHSFDEDLSALFDRDGRGAGEALAAEPFAADFFFDQPQLDDASEEEALRAVLEGEYKRHLYQSRRTSPTLGSMGDYVQLFEEANPPELAPYYKRRLQAPAFSTTTSVFEGMDEEANPPEMSPEFKRNLKEHARPLLERLVIPGGSS
ncbi:hypothetical protein DFJ74DRAFT_680811 [Hyaloraphidium curvatum]|nr:hypothetical protein DFJ74DRAFT_680811 [Hyaloraphidium curvatum]